MQLGTLTNTAIARELVPEPIAEVRELVPESIAEVRELFPHLSRIENFQLTSIPQTVDIGPKTAYNES